MMHRCVLPSVLLAAVIGCAGSANVRACEVQLLVTNSTSFTIVEVGYRKPGSLEWSNNLLSGRLVPNSSQFVGWNGDGDYEIVIRTTNRPTDPITIQAPGICNKSQVVASPTGVIIN